MWGNSPQNYADFCKKGLKNADGIITDIGCGTLSFTHKVYAENIDKNLFLCDLSLEMLKIGKSRLESTSKDISAITFLRSNALNMPFKDNIVQTALSFGIFHIFENPSKLIKEIVRILKPEGQLFLSSLCTDRKISEKYLDFFIQKRTRC
jgi:ubiquinone/menaquinone biosynthesis C-methylase UbiE